MPLSMLRTRPRLQTNAMQGTAGQGQGSGAQKAVALRRMRRRRACSRRHLASGAPDVYGDVTRAARGRMGSYGHSSWTLANHQDAHGTFSNHDTASYVVCFVVRLVPSSACQVDSVRDGHIARLSQLACCPPPRHAARLLHRSETHKSYFIRHTMALFDPANDDRCSVRLH